MTQSQDLNCGAQNKLTSCRLIYAIIFPIIYAVTSMLSMLSSMLSPWCSSSFHFEYRELSSLRNKCRPRSKLRGTKLTSCEPVGYLTLTFDRVTSPWPGPAWPRSAVYTHPYQRMHQNSKRKTYQRSEDMDDQPKHQHNLKCTNRLPYFRSIPHHSQLIFISTSTIS